MNTCSVSQDLAAHDAAHDNDDAYFDAIDSKTRELMAAGEPNYPFDLSNISDAMCEIDKEKIADYLSASDFHSAGVSLSISIIAYWREKAKKRATEIIDSGCQQCFGSGCLSCE